MSGTIGIISGTVRLQVLRVQAVRVVVWRPERHLVRRGGRAGAVLSGRTAPGGDGDGAYGGVMYLENLVFDAVDPRRLGRFWRATLDARTLTDEPEGFEIRLHHPGGPDLDLCFQAVPQQPSEPLRLHLDLRGAEHQLATVDRLLALGARPLDIGQSDVPWVVLGDVEGNPFCVMERRAVYVETGPIAALPLDSADPNRDGVLWAWLTGWTPTPGVAPVTLRHASRRGPLLELWPEPEPKGPYKNRLHLDVRLESGDDPDEVAAGIRERGGRALDHGWGPLPWQVYADGSGNEFCVLAARS